MWGISVAAYIYICLNAFIKDAYMCIYKIHRYVCVYISVYT